MPLPLNGGGFGWGWDQRWPPSQPSPTLGGRGLEVAIPPPVNLLAREGRDGETCAIEATPVCTLTLPSPIEGKGILLAFHTGLMPNRIGGRCR